MRNLLILLAVVGCGGSDNHPVDAAIDAAPVTLDCSSYCANIQKNCTGVNAQYADTSHCMSSCTSFSVGTLTDTNVNTLGCRLHFAAIPAATAADCGFAGPAGDLATAPSPGGCSGGNLCTSFCALEIQACGSLKVPLNGNPRDGDGNPLYQYQDVNDCLKSCPPYDRNHAYVVGPPPSSGDSLACRLFRATDAATSLDNATTSCAATAALAQKQCAGTATP